MPRVFWSLMICRNCFVCDVIRKNSKKEGQWEREGEEKEKEKEKGKRR